ncbi:MAG TPA: cyclic nucleotide-binding domain-containing protein, partial [Polyangiaceae bacterium]|nr:cyclic nucleotide-binding domain-containing protein [Polyangiaceae bacterium]
ASEPPPSGSRDSQRPDGQPASRPSGPPAGASADLGDLPDAPVDSLDVIEVEDVLEIIEVIPAPKRAPPLPPRAAPRPPMRSEPEVEVVAPGAALDPAPEAPPAVALDPAPEAPPAVALAPAPEAPPAVALDPAPEAPPVVAPAAPLDGRASFDEIAALPAPDGEPRQTLPFPSSDVQLESSPGSVRVDPPPAETMPAAGTRQTLIGSPLAGLGRETLAHGSVAEGRADIPTPVPSAPSEPPEALPRPATPTFAPPGPEPAPPTPEPAPPTPEPAPPVVSVELLGPLADELGPDAARAVAASATVVECPATSLLFKHGEPADGLYLVLSGRLRVEGESIEAGALIGEEAVLEEARRPHDAQPTGGPATLLRIPRMALEELTPTFPEVELVFLKHLRRRLVDRLLASSPLFSVFDPDTQRQFLELFEVRSVTAGETLEEGGKRAEALWILLAGELTLDDGAGGLTPVPLRGIVGAGGVLGAPSAGTLRATRAGLVLRLGARRFGRLMAEYPPALAHLSELA